MPYLIVHSCICCCIKRLFFFSAKIVLVLSSFVVNPSHRHFKPRKERNGYSSAAAIWFVKADFHYSPMQGPPRGVLLFQKSARCFLKQFIVQEIFDGFFLKTKGFLLRVLLKVNEIFGSEIPLAAKARFSLSRIFKAGTVLHKKGFVTPDIQIPSDTFSRNGKVN